MPEAGAGRAAADGTGLLTLPLAPTTSQESKVKISQEATRDRNRKERTLKGPENSCGRHKKGRKEEMKKKGLLLDE